MNTAEIRIAKLVPLFSLAILLTAAALAWAWESRNAQTAVAGQDLHTTNGKMLTVGAKSLAAQIMEDKTTGFSGAHH